MDELKVARSKRRTCLTFMLGLMLTFPVFSRAITPDSRENGTYPGLAQDIAVDPAGNIYVTGYGFSEKSGHDYLTLKFAPEGQLVWAERYDGPAGGEDFAQAVCLDRDGNPVVTGHSAGLDSSLDAVTIKYDPDGQPLWMDRYDGPASRDDWSYRVVADTAGTVVIGGYSFGSGTEHDFLAVTYGVNGDRLRVMRYNSDLDRDDILRALVLDPKGNICMAGVDRVASTAYDFVTMKYAPGGDRLWLARVSGPGGVFDGAEDIAVDLEGNIYATGERCMSEDGGHTDGFSVKYSPEGKRLWSAVYDGPGRDFDSGLRLVVDGEGGVYVAGKTLNPSTGFDIFVVKYDSSGGKCWDMIFNGSGDGADIVRDIVLSADRRLILAGHSRSLGTGRDCLTLALDTETGRVIWKAVYDAGTGGEDAGTALALDHRGSVCVAGYSLKSGTDYEYAVLKYHPDGNLVWRTHGPDRDSLQKKIR